jgi:hypothetical protein
MFQQFTTILILTSITLQGVFGGLQHSVSICLGGGHEHNTAEVVEHCEFECEHHSKWPTPIGNDKDIENCGCTDVVLGLITLVTTPKDANEGIFTILSVENTLARTLDTLPQPTLRGPPQLSNLDIPAKQQQLVVVRTTRLLL